MKIFILLFLLVPTLSWADVGDTYRCEMTSYVSVENSRASNRPLERFVFHRRERDLRFEYGFFTNTVLNVDESYYEMFRASGGYSNAVYSQGNFAFSQAYELGAITVTARCFIAR
jgi:hypothetical protein